MKKPIPQTSGIGIVTRETFCTDSVTGYPIPLGPFPIFASGPTFSIVESRECRDSFAGMPFRASRPEPWIIQGSPPCDGFAFIVNERTFLVKV